MLGITCSASVRGPVQLGQGMCSSVLAFVDPARSGGSGLRVAGMSKKLEPGAKGSRRAMIHQRSATKLWVVLTRHQDPTLDEVVDDREQALF